MTKLIAKSPRFSYKEVCSLQVWFSALFLSHTNTYLCNDSNFRVCVPIKRITTALFILPDKKKKKKIHFEC